MLSLNLNEQKSALCMKDYHEISLDHVPILRRTRVPLPKVQICSQRVLDDASGG